MASGETFYDAKTETFLPGARCDIEQYRMLKRCSKGGDIGEWNQWRDKHRGEDIWLYGANLLTAHLDGAYLRAAHLDGAVLAGTHLDGANLVAAHLDGTNLAAAHLDGADLWQAHLDGADLSQACLRGANFRAAAVDGTTLLWGNAIDRKTDFTGVGLADARVEPGLKQLLEYNVRRIGWRNWYKRGPWWLKVLKRVFVQPFWWVSDYGRATGRIGAVFFAFAAIFAFVYRLCPQCLMVRGEVGAVRGFLHAFYFSVVTQTTLGFGDIHANPASPYGQLLLMLQVLLGYVLLGALVTRFAVLFAAGGPAGRFSPRPKKKRRKDEG
ncbi:MAG: pentapeptide repeat-containing protein [Candidatus Brocadiae bacterium]|nr:pentapeptide repeat-containing protein [Candidatus Brocadiia bacterium]